MKPESVHGLHIVTGRTMYGMEDNRSPVLTGVLRSNGYELDRSTRRLGRLLPVPDAERKDLGALRARFDRDGYLFLPGFLDRESVLDFRRHYFATLAPSGLSLPGTDPGEGVAAPREALDPARLRTLLFKELVPGQRYEALCRDPRLVAFYRWFLGTPDLHLHRRKIIRHVGPGESGIGTATQAHYDLVYLREGSSNVVSCWIPLGDVPVDRGPLIYLEGSHRKVLAQEAAGTLKRPAASITADLPALAEEYDSRWLVTDFSAGDLMVHSAHIVHASLDNEDPAGRFRLSTDIRYQAAGEPIDRRWQNHWHDEDGL
ncbi:phytanoyl-CoA dioxygenase family protein [Kitasatospora sp. NBC_00240]|uniref:phytanoyl-CoA dioxygenase family protein n=1 Tax=Kitasatospora sp. NBC_00240 TaxID=2903567 RepID=UPI00224C8D4F|nr:phytanoyl-CoA dioxygenase family protein [Kitasatospora sp. NBC_00240]MCX5214532.1 phytanoyl-CoA dioxygenase family protein [Kitasatospora sp. NBC_00240]